MKQIQGFVNRLSFKLTVPWKLRITPTSVSLNCAQVSEHWNLNAALSRNSQMDSIVPYLLEVAQAASYDGRAMSVEYLGFGESVRFRYDLRTEDGIKAWQRKLTQESRSPDSGIEVSAIDGSIGAALALIPRDFEFQLQLALREVAFEFASICPLAIMQLVSSETSPGVHVQEEGGYTSVLLRSARGPEVQFVWPNERVVDLPKSWLSLCHAAGCSPELVLDHCGDPAAMSHHEASMKSVRHVPNLLLRLLDVLAPKTRWLAIAGASLLLVVAGVILLESKRASAEQIQVTRTTLAQHEALTNAAREARYERWVEQDWAHGPVSPLLAAAGESPPRKVTFKSARQLTVAPPTLVVEGTTPDASPVRDWLEGLPEQKWAARGKLVKLAPPHVRDSSGFVFQVVLESP